MFLLKSNHLNIASIIPTSTNPSAGMTQLVHMSESERMWMKLALSERFLTFDIFFRYLYINAYSDWIGMYMN